MDFPVKDILQYTSDPYCNQHNNQYKKSKNKIQLKEEEL
jgi:hypothetical protein